MSRRPRAPRKRRTREHVIADLSVNHVERQALLCGHSMERWVHDYGIDLVLLTYSATGESESGNILIQAKATEKVRRAQGGEFISFRIERSNLRAWVIEPMPVILIVYDVSDDRAYWLYIQAAFAGASRFQAMQGPDRVTVRIPVGQVLNADAIGRFRVFRDAILVQSQGVIHRE